MIVVLNKGTLLDLSKLRFWLTIHAQNVLKCSYIKKRPKHKTSLSTQVSNTINGNCISTSESTPKLVKRLRQVFWLIKQSIPLFTSLLCHFHFLKNNSGFFFQTHRVVFQVVCAPYLLFLCFFQRLLFGAVYFRCYCTSVIFLVRFFIH